VPAPEKSLLGFFWGLQNCLAILHAAKTRIPALLNHGKKQMSYPFYTCQQKNFL
jgi:hypothetical protein